MEHALVPTPRCDQCFKPIPEQYGDGKCYDCLGESLIDGVIVERVVAATFYLPKGWRAPHQDEIWRLKNSGDFADQYANVLAYVMREEEVSIGENEVLVPIPDTTGRGPSAAPYLLAEGLSKELELPLNRSLSFVRDVRSQKDLSLAERIENMEGAMSFAESLNGENIILVDDLMASGCTMHEGGRAVRERGAGSVKGAVAARVVGLDHLVYVGVVEKK